MPEDSPQPAAKTTPKRRPRLVDTIVFIVLVGVMIALSFTLFNRLSLKNQVASAKVTANQVITDIAKQDAKALRSLGNKKFQAAYSATELDTLLKSAAPLTIGTPKIVDQTVSNDNKSKNVVFVYRYPGDKATKPYYVRVVTSQAKGTDKWQLIGLSGDPSEAKLVIR